MKVGTCSIYILNQKHNGYTLTRFCHSFDGNILFVGHEAQHREDSKTCHKACAAVQTTQHDTVPEEQDREKLRKRSHLLLELSLDFTPQPTQTYLLPHSVSYTDQWWTETKMIQCVPINHQFYQWASSGSLHSVCWQVGWLLLSSVHLSTSIYHILTCSSYCCRNCNFPKQWDSPSRWHRRRRFVFLHPPIPDVKVGINIWYLYTLDW